MASLDIKGYLGKYGIPSILSSRLTLEAQMESSGQSGDKKEKQAEKIVETVCIP